MDQTHTLASLYNFTDVRAVSRPLAFSLFRPVDLLLVEKSFAAIVIIVEGYFLLSALRLVEKHFTFFPRSLFCAS